LADVGLMVPSHERGFQKSSRALALSAGLPRINKYFLFKYFLPCIPEL
jgi:hypothetical protein